MIAEIGRTSEDRIKLTAAVRGTANKKEFFNSFHAALPRFASIETNQEWGKRLLCFTRNDRTREGGNKRPIELLLEEAMRCNIYSYQLARSTMQMDPQSGRLVERSKQ